MTNKFALFLVFLLFVLFLSDGFSQQLKFSGEIEKGNSFHYKISKNLFFELLPGEFGWIISIRDSDYNENYCAIATPPFHGINSLYIEGWHFRNSDNSGPNEAGEKNINAPQEIRQFSFVLDKESYERTAALLDTILYSGNNNNENLNKAETELKSMKKGIGRLEIVDMKLMNLKVGEKAGFEYMKFSVELNIPAP
ncbi:MAG TPA: hypothetical protein VMT35_17355 [Ignavibacteriaceae bacterium]|nr:hypothetical protein [Ignavibacteriaceae bacterium]